MNSAISYGYDALGRVTRRAIGGAANIATVDYDALGRLYTATNLLGTFSLGYVGNTNRIQSVSRAGGQTTQYSYLDNLHDQRLADISNYQGAVGSNLLSKFDYAYDVGGRITQWSQQADAAAPTTWRFGYDQASQLLSAVNRDTSGNVLNQFSYAYDLAGNRTSTQTDGTVLATSFNNVNQSGAQAAGGSLLWQGHSNKALYSVALNGQQATLADPTHFSGSVPVTGGTNSVHVVAEDTSANVTASNFQVVIPAGSASGPTFDQNGNMTQDAQGNTYAWDAKNELVQITYPGGAQSAFTYDGLGRRVQIVETDGSGTITSTKQFVFDGVALAEERDASGAVTKRFFDQGEQISGASYYFTRDHLGSVREMTDGSGTIQARYGYSPYGVRAKLSGSMDADFGFTGDYWHAPGGLALTLYRGYSADLGGGSATIHSGRTEGSICMGMF